MTTMEQLAQGLLTARPCIANATSRQKSALLEAIARSLETGKESVLAANARDVAQAAENGLSPVMTDRLLLDSARIDAIAAAVRKVAALPDPVGEVVGGRTLPNGLRLQKVRVPLGVIGIIYEARPNVTVDAAALCLKTSNAVLLRGGKEAIHSNRALVARMRAAIEAEGFDPNILTLVEDTSRESANAMMRLSGVLDVLIPRGGAGLIRSVVENASVPVIETGSGNCHIYVDRDADLSMAADILYNAKTSRPSVCNACESLLVHEAVAAEFLPLAAARLADKQVELRGCPRTRAVLGDRAAPATEADYAAEFLDYILSVKVVDDIGEAIAHIARYSTHHSEAIVTSSLAAANRFTAEVDSAAVYVNASTRFTDGEEFGFGAEIGIATQKLHARGPMGLPELTSTKYILTGNGQLR